MFSAEQASKYLWLRLPVVNGSKIKFIQKHKQASLVKIDTETDTKGPDMMALMECHKNVVGPMALFELKT